MTSPARAIAWEFQQRLRWGLVGAGVYIVALVAVKILNPSFGDMDSGEVFALTMNVPMAAMFTYFVAAFTFGLEGDVAARQSMFPTRMFTKPVTTSALAGWPMLYGAVLSAVVWLAARLVGAWPASLHVPVVWPALLAADLMLWAQALMWMPYGLPGLRIVAMVVWLTLIDVVVILSLYFKASEPVMAAFLAPQMPLAYLVGRYAVTRARQGDVPDWRGAFAWLTAAGRRTRATVPLATPARAQAWFEWRRNGWSLPLWVAVLLPIDLLLLGVAGPSPSLVLEILFGACFIPVVMAAFGAMTVSSSTGGNVSYNLSTFVAAKPLTNGQIIAAKFRMTLRSTALAWLLVLVAIPVGLQLSGEMPLALDRFHRFAVLVGMPRAVAVVLLVIGAFVLATWKQLVQSLYVGLSGRLWLIRTFVVVVVTLLFAIGPVLQWIVQTHRLGALWSAIPTIFSVLAALKLSAAAWIVVQLYRGRLVADRTLVVSAALWCAAVFALYALLLWMFATPHIPRYVLLLFAILAMPFARVSAAPLALARNRHR